MAEPPSLTCSRRQTLIMLTMLLLLCLLIFSTSIVAANNNITEHTEDEGYEEDTTKNCTATDMGQSVACIAPGSRRGEQLGIKNETNEGSMANKTKAIKQNRNGNALDRVPATGSTDIMNINENSEHPFHNEVTAKSVINSTRTLSSYDEEENFKNSTNSDRTAQELILEEYNAWTEVKLFSNHTSPVETNPGHSFVIDGDGDSSYPENPGTQHELKKRSVVSVRSGPVCENATCDRDRKVIHGFAMPCHCDALCDLYGDCCEVTSEDVGTPPPPPGVPLSLLQKPVADRWTCRPLQAAMPFLKVFMVKFCPAGSSHLVDRCEGRPGPQQNYSYLLDVPVVSSVTGIVYYNFYCALCHQDSSNLEHFQVDLLCSDPYLAKEIASMKYHPGELRWTKEPVTKEIAIVSECILELTFDLQMGRVCEEDVVTTCASPHGGVGSPCPPHTYYVMGTADSRVYLNSECAQCNGISQDSMLCLPVIPLRSHPDVIYPPSLTDIFTVNGGCPENQLWDPIHRWCEDIVCGHLYVLQNGECVRNDEIIPGTKEPFLNSSCTTSSYPQDFGKVYPNGSLFLESTELMYNKTEYEFTEDGRIRVCRPPDRWTPTMNVISTVLISLSLVGMILHICIFLLLPKGRNIPGMNLFSMTCSLFIAELFFVSLFNSNHNRAACITVALVIYYFLSAAFLWMNIMSIDIYRTFHSKTYMAKSRKMYIIYSVYAWTVPLACSLLAIMLDRFASASIISPQFGTNQCWFNNKWGLVVFFTFPAGFVVVVNMVLYSLSVFDIYKQHKSGELAASTVRKSDIDSKESHKSMEKEKFLNPVYLSSQEISKESPGYAERLKERLQRRIKNNKKQRIRLVLYSKLAIIMGMTWIFAFISMHTRSLVFEYLFIVFNGLQGTFIFIAFDCKWKVWYDLRERFTGKVHKPSKTETSSSNTRQTWMSSSSSGYRNSNRWSKPLHTNNSDKRASNRFSKDNVVDSEGEESSFT